MFKAAFSSRSMFNPQAGQSCTRTDNALSTTIPQHEHRCDVPLGSTNRTTRPASSALYMLYWISCLQAASPMLFGLVHSAFQKRLPHCYSPTAATIGGKSPCAGWQSVGEYEPPLFAVCLVRVSLFLPSTCAAVLLPVLARLSGRNADCQLSLHSRGEKSHPTSTPTTLSHIDSRCSGTSQAKQAYQLPTRSRRTVSVFTCPSMGR